MTAKLAARAQEVITIIDAVYTPFKTTHWKPKNFSENKSRYLWTDAFGVVTYLTLFTRTGKAEFLEQAQILVDNVHENLGRTRDGQKRLGNATEERPLLGGLRIGKPKDEGPGMSEDGQYYHYLTKWMFALNRMSVVTGDRKYNDWAIDMVKKIHPCFVKKTTGRPRMFWKMSIDLSKALVPSEGGLDPYDGYVMYRLLQDKSDKAEILRDEIGDMKNMVESKYEQYRTNDALDAGEALWLAHFFPDEDWAQHLYKRASEAVEALWTNGKFDGSDRYRLAFREFGTTIGVQMDDRLREVWMERVSALHQFWAGRLFERDSDITPVMYCASLLPGYFRKQFAHSCTD